MVDWIPSPFHESGRYGHRPRWLILHGTAGGSSARGVAYWFQDPRSGASTHYIIGQDGHIVQCVSETDTAYGNGFLSPGHDDFWPTGISPNLLTISIEHVKSATDNSNQITPAQKQASFNLIKEICQRWNIPMKPADASGGITGHYSLDPESRSRCPGPYPWDELFRFLNNNEGEDELLDITSTFARTYFVQDGDRWRCTAKSHNHLVFGAILHYYRQIQGAPRLPVTGEIYSIPGCVYQIFESGIIMYDPHKRIDWPAIDGPCYLVKLDSELGKKLTAQKYIDLAAQAQSAAKAAESQALVFKSQLDNARKQVTDLQAQLSQSVPAGFDIAMLKDRIEVALEAVEEAATVSGVR